MKKAIIIIGVLAAIGGVVALFNAMTESCFDDECWSWR